MKSVKKEIIDKIKNKQILEDVSSVKNTSLLREELLDDIVNFKSLKKSSFTKKLMSYNLSVLGVKESQQLGRFNSSLSSSSASYDGKSKSVVLDKNVYDNFFRIIELIDSVSHESYHSYQDYNLENEKYNFDINSRSMISHSRRLPKILGLNNLEDTLYYTNLMERQAFKYATKFTEEFLKDALDKANNEDKQVSALFLNKALSYYTKHIKIPMNKTFLKADKKFIENIPKLYEKADKTIGECFDVLYGAVGIRDNVKNFVSTIKLNRAIHLKDKNNSVIRPFIAITEVLGAVPIRERVEEYLDYALSTEGASETLIYMLLQEKVPLTRGDVLKIFLCSDYYKDKPVNFLEDYSLYSFDEDTIAKNMLITQGSKVTKEKLGNLFKDKDKFNSKFNTGRLDILVNLYPESRMFLHGKQFEGASQVLDFALNKLIEDEVIDQDDYDFTKVDIANNLVDIILHFDYPNPNNIDYQLALNKFIENPYECQFEVEEEFSELSSLHDYKLSEKLASYMQQVRQENNAQIEEDFAQ